VLTIRERFGTLQGLRIAFVGDARNNVAVSVAEAAALSGMSITFAAPPSRIARPTLFSRVW
jgi:ornithine carbamoyltransferase